LAQGLPAVSPRNNPSGPRARPPGSGRALLLVAEDEGALAALLRRDLKERGFHVREYANELEALILIAEACPVAHENARSAVNGTETGTGNNTERIASIAKLLANMIKFSAEMGTVLQRNGTHPGGELIEFRDIILEPDSFRAQRNGRLLKLSPTEFRLLKFLIQHPGQVFSRQEILCAVWGPKIHVEPRTVDVHIRRLRNAINGRGELNILRTVRTIGYILDR
jgi:two-component system phosphate regulon response regulator PhoB